MAHTLTGKSRGILLRLPHFFGPTEAGDLLVQFVETFGRSLEHAEDDLYRILHGHHVETADNEVARGGKRGDLDRVLALYLDALGGTSQLVKVSPAFTTRSFDPRRLARSLVAEGHPLAAYVRQRLEAAGAGLLRDFRVENTQFVANEINPDFAMDVLLGRTPLGPYLQGRLSEETAALLNQYDGLGTLERPLQQALANDLNGQVLGDPALYRKHFAYFEGLELNAASAHTIRVLRAGIFREFLHERLAGPLPDELHLRIRDDLASAAPIASPAGDDLRRLNRLLLEEAARSLPQPWGFRASGVPGLEEVRKVLLTALNALLADPTLFRADRFPELADEYATLQKRYEGRPAWLNRMLLETAFPDAIEASYTPYRQRLLGLIQVLRRGASTRRGIVDIVAANLGIIGDDADARHARALIEIEEYRPKRTQFFTGSVGYGRPFDLTNPTLLDASPEVRITMLPAPESQLGGRVLTNLRIYDPKTKQEALFPGRVRALDQLVISGASVLLNGIAPPVGLIGTVPEVADEGASWVFTADVVVPGTEAGTERVLPIARFDKGVGAGLGTFDNAVFAPANPPVAIEVSSYKPFPGNFTVVIPWHIEGYTDKFDEQDHPRKQIGALVGRVKAAGVRAMVAYRLVFPEVHEMEAGLRIEAEGQLLSEEQDLADGFSALTQQSVREDHNLGDHFDVSARLGYTRFNSGNPLA